MFVAVVFILALFGQATYLAVISIFTGHYKVSLLVVLLLHFIWVGAATYRFFLSNFLQPQGECQHIDFSSNPEIFAYVPQIKLPSQPFPYLVCDIDDIDQGLIGWNNPAHSYDFYNLIYDVPHKSLRRTVTIEDNTRGTATIAQHEAYQEIEGENRATTGVEVTSRSAQLRPIYSIIKHYPTKWQIELAKNEDQDWK